MASQDRFGYEWSRYSSLDPNYEGQFWNWVAPLSAKDFAGKRVIDAGCGMGRNSYWALRAGAKEVLAFDYNESSLDSARKTLAEYKNVKIQFLDIHKIPFENEFDVAMSIGVIHHLEDSALALKGLFKSLVVGGTLVIWVYSKEGYEWVPKYINPIRKHITSKLPLVIVEAVSFVLSIPLYLFVKLAKPRSSYLRQLGSFGLAHIRSIVFDQLIPTIANYWTKEQVKQLFTDSGIKNFNIYRPSNENGWTVVAKKQV